MVGSKRTQKGEVSVAKGPPELDPHFQGMAQNGVVYSFSQGVATYAVSQRVLEAKYPGMILAQC